MSDVDYLKDRLEHQIDWYDKKSQFNQKLFKLLRIIEILAAALIPFLTGMAEHICYSQWLIGGLGILIALSAGVMSLYRLQENWIKYRTTAEQLKHEKWLYITHTAPYNSDDKLALLVQRTEALISSENSAWAQVNQPKKSPDNKQPTDSEE